MNLDKLPKVSFISMPTPLEYMSNLSKRLGGPQIYFKRDDLTGLGLGGNKVRKLEYLMGEALAQGCQTAVTTAALHSNFLRVFAAACNRCGIRPVVFMRGEPEPPVGNYLCTTLLGAELHYITTKDPFSDDTIKAMTEYAKEEEKKGRKTYKIHLGTYSGPLAAVGYIAGAAELFRQTDVLGLEIDAIYAATGSGGTHGGLLAGARLLGKTTKIVGTSVNLDAELLVRNISGMMEQYQPFTQGIVIYF